MTNEELFTAVYLVCGSLPPPPESEKDPNRFATRHRRKLADGRWHYWLTDDEVSYGYDVVARVIQDPAFMEYFDKAARLGMTVEKFSAYVTWVEEHERKCFPS